MPAVDNIDTFVVLMLENRSFDHMLGYLSLAGGNVNGLSSDPAWLNNFTNVNAGQSYPVHRLGADVASIPDPPHDRTPIAIQINTPCSPGGCPELGGFVQTSVPRRRATCRAIRARRQSRGRSACRVSVSPICRRS
jgi:phospholipase C